MENPKEVADELYLGLYYNSKTYIKDTAQHQGVGVYSFENASEGLEKGFYFLMNVKKELLVDFVVGEDQHFELILDGQNYAEGIQVKGDKDNEQLAEARRLSIESGKEMEPLIALYEDSTRLESERKEWAKRIQEIHQKRIEKLDKLIEAHPNFVSSRYLLSTKSVELPLSLREDENRNNGSKEDTLARIYYYREHFFDNFPLSDSLSMRMPGKNFFENKIKEYLNTLHEPKSDTIIAAIKRMERFCGENKETFREIVWITTIEYQRPKIMGLDKVFVYLYDQYYVSGFMDSYANDALKGNIKKEADAKRLTLIGEIGKDLIMQDAELKPRSLYEMSNKYRIVYFFNPDCHACAQETPKLTSFYKNTKFDVGVFAVCTDTSMVKLKNYVSKYALEDWQVVSGPRTYVGSFHKLYDARTTPTIIVLDRKKRIIAKKNSCLRLGNIYRKS